MALGLQLGQGLPRAACFDGRPVVVEGERNAKSVNDLARRVGVSMPICETVFAILHQGADIGTAFADLWARPIEAEPSAMLFSLDHPASDADVKDLARRIA
jgi:glycerol-3-phosphate dehydrogenase (NAD(P)+)